MCLTLKPQSFLLFLIQSIERIGVALTSNLPRIQVSQQFEIFNFLVLIILQGAPTTTTGTCYYKKKKKEEKQPPYLITIELQLHFLTTVTHCTTPLTFL